MSSSHRRFKLRIWALALGYFGFYAPYVASIKLTTSGQWLGGGGPVSGFRMLPAVVISTALVLTVIVSFKGWWKYSGHRQIFGLSIPFPRPMVLLSGLGTAVIIGTTTLIFTFPGFSIVFALVLMRGGVLVMGPIIDRLFKRHVRWFSWAALAITGIAVVIAIADVNNYRFTATTALIIGAYISGYVLRLPCATKLAKADDTSTTYRYFVEEQMVAMGFLVVIPAVLALIGKGQMMMEMRQGFTEFFTSAITVPALIIGAFYACLYCFGTLVYLDCRENTFCIPLNRGSSLLAGFATSYALTLLFGMKPPSEAQLASAGLLVVALLLLSPFHHVLEHGLEKVKFLFADNYRLLLNIARGRQAQTVNHALARSVSQRDVLSAETQATNQQKFGHPGRTFLFVCSGNTCRSPMAAAIANRVIAVRLKIPIEDFVTVNARALSAGLSARAGEPLAPEAQEALRSLNVPVRPHAARNLTVELADQAEMIFCMTSAHRKAVIDMIPSVAWKTFCLDPESDIEDPMGSGLEAYLKCAGHIDRLISWRFDEALLNANV